MIQLLPTIHPIVHTEPKLWRYICKYTIGGKHTASPDPSRGRGSLSENVQPYSCRAHTVQGSPDLEIVEVSIAPSDWIH